MPEGHRRGLEYPPLGGFLVITKGQALSVISVTYGVVLRILQVIADKGVCLWMGSENPEFWFRKPRILVPKTQNEKRATLGS